MNKFFVINCNNAVISKSKEKLNINFISDAKILFYVSTMLPIIYYWLNLDQDQDAVFSVLFGILF